MNMTRTFLHYMIGLMAATGIGLLSLLGLAGAQEQHCTVPAHFYDSEPTLPQTTAALASGQTVFIVALGGASTLGRAAGRADLAWPARLAVALGSRFPTAQVKVDNRAVARQTAQEMAARLDREVIALQPTLVIWETGTTDAVSGTDLDDVPPDDAGRYRSAPEVWRRSGVHGHAVRASHPCHHRLRQVRERPA